MPAPTKNRSQTKDAVAAVTSLRRQLGITQQSLARLLGVHPMTVSAWGARQAATHNLAAQSGRGTPSVPAASKSGAEAEGLRIESHPCVGSPALGRNPAQHCDHSVRAIPTKPPTSSDSTGQSATSSARPSATPTLPMPPAQPLPCSSRSGRIDPFFSP